MGVSRISIEARVQHASTWATLHFNITWFSQHGKAGFISFSSDCSLIPIVTWAGLTYPIELEAEDGDLRQTENKMASEADNMNMHLFFGYLTKPFQLHELYSVELHKIIINDEDMIL